MFNHNTKLSLTRLAASLTVVGALQFVAAFAPASPFIATAQAQEQAQENVVTEHSDHSTADDIDHSPATVAGNVATEQGHEAIAEHDQEHGMAGAHAEGEHGEGGDHHGSGSPFEPHAGSWINPIARIFAGEAPVTVQDPKTGEIHVSNPNSIRYDAIVIAVLILIALGLVGFVAGKNVKIRPEGKPTSIPNLVEAAFDGFQNYLVGIMGHDLAVKYTPLVGTFFFTILICNWIGLIPGMIAPTSNANVPIALAIVAFFATHIIAIREAGFKSWFMHFVGEPKGLAFLNFPLHVIGELIKPLSLAIRLLCNVFGEEMVIIQLGGLAVTAMAVLYLPIPFQFPMMCLGVFFGALQALVFSTLLAIYVAILSNHHDDHDEHNVHGHVEHTTQSGHRAIVAHPSETTVA